MSSRRSEQERAVSATCLVVFAAFLLAMMLWNTIWYTIPTRYTLHAEFLERANAPHVMGMFLAYLVISAVGFVGVLGLVQTYGSGVGLIADVVRLSGLAFFVTNYWLWAAVFVVQHRITLLTDRPSNPPEWLLQVFDASSSLWALPSWGAITPSILFYLGCAWLLLRSSRLLPRIAAAVFALLAVSQLLVLVYAGLRGLQFYNLGGFTFAYINDLLYTGGQVVGYLFAGAAMLTERGIFSRTAMSRTASRGGTRIGPPTGRE
ncbi:MAG: hypothetical protein JSV80_12905 [Acidobacteriota bacterium]|nr:MAG: hypothetical protein JSV80_12905 [Acidobacteriota bacterium]